MMQSLGPRCATIEHALCITIIASCSAIPEPYLNPKPETLNRKPQALNPKALNLKPQTVNPKALNLLYIRACYPKTLNPMCIIACYP